MQEVIPELLSQGRSKAAINPERMIIGLRAFLMITDSLEKKEGDPPMPINTGPLPSRGVSRIKNRFLSNTLSDETAKKIGILQFYPGSVTQGPVTSSLWLHYSLVCGGL